MIKKDLESFPDQSPSPDIDHRLNSPHIDSIGSRGNPPVVLLKRVPADTTKEEIKEKLADFGMIVNIKLLKHKLYAYVEFNSVESARICVEHFSNNPLEINGSNISVFITCSGRQELKPLDLNPPSKILLLTFFKNKIPVTIRLVVDLISEYDAVQKIIIYEKQNIHALIELKNLDSSIRIKEGLDGKKWNNLFLVRVQYTLKKSLSINPNSPLEYECPKHEVQTFGYEEQYPQYDTGYYHPQGYQQQIRKALPKQLSKYLPAPAPAPHYYEQPQYSQQHHYAGQMQKNYPFQSPQMYGYGHSGNKPSKKTSALSQYCTPTIPVRKYDPQKEMNIYRIVKVDGLPHVVTAELLFNIFSQYGFIVLVKISQKEDEISGFIQFHEHNEALIVRDLLQGIYLFGSQMKIMLTKYTSAEEIDYFERDAYNILADYSEANEIQRFKIPGAPKTARLARPNQTIEIHNAPPHCEERIIKIIAKDCSILNHHSTEEAIYFHLSSIEEATIVIAKYNNIDINGACINIFYSLWLQSTSPGYDDLPISSPYLGSHESPFPSRRDMYGSPLIRGPESPFYPPRQHRQVMSSYLSHDSSIQYMQSGEYERSANGNNSAYRQTNSLLRQIDEEGVRPRHQKWIGNPTSKGGDNSDNKASNSKGNKEPES